LDNVVGEQQKKVLGELGGFKTNGESVWRRNGDPNRKFTMLVRSQLQNSCTPFEDAQGLPMRLV
jgi:hypothetical protein